VEPRALKLLTPLLQSGGAGLVERHSSLASREQAHPQLLGCAFVAAVCCCRFATGASPACRGCPDSARFPPCGDGPALPSVLARSFAAPSPSLGLLKFSGVKDPYELEGWNPKTEIDQGKSCLPGNPRLPRIRPLLASTSDFSSQAQPCPGRGRSCCIAASRTWAQSERAHPSRVLTAPAA
jgi:hypothetical protein